MRNQRIYTDQTLIPGEVITLEKASSHHIANVLRFKPGAEIILFNGLNGEYSGYLESVQKNAVTVNVAEVNEVSRESPLKVTLIQGVSRGSRMDYTLQKAVELGVSEIVPVMTSRSQVKLTGDRLEKKIKHWKGVIHSACEQSGRTQIPMLHTCRSLLEWLQSENFFELKLLLDPAAELTLPTINQPDGKICIIIGPEGGLSNEEIKNCAKYGFTGISLGPRILRTETAALVALSALQTLWGDLA